MGYDLIGDIHGEAPTLRALLEKLGYQDTATGGGRDVAVTDTGDLNGDGISDIDKYIDEETKRIIDDNDWA